MINTPRIMLVALPLAFSTPVSVADTTPDDASLISNARSAAPTAIANGATVKDWNDRTLQQGSNGWTCYPDLPSTPTNDPMCFDAPWTDWANAWMKKEKPQVTRVGISYMLMGGSDASNDDPFAEKPGPGKDWFKWPPHIMIIVPDPKQLEGLPTDPNNGGPWVMYKGTPYAHIMVPVK
jgi:hypothetical protein